VYVVFGLNTYLFLPFYQLYDVMSTTKELNNHKLKIKVPKIVLTNIYNIIVMNKVLLKKKP